MRLGLGSWWLCISEEIAMMHRDLNFYGIEIKSYFHTSLETRNKPMNAFEIRMNKFAPNKFSPECTVYTKKHGNFQ